MTKKYTHLSAIFIFTILNTFLFQNCGKYQSQNFKKDQSSTADPVPNNPANTIVDDNNPIDFTKFELKTMAKGLDEHMKIEVVKTKQGFLLTDKSNYRLPQGYDFRYFIGSDIINLKTPLKDYLVSTKNPFRVLKFMTKEGLDTLNRWGANGESNGYYDQNAAQTFSNNVSAGFHTFAPVGPKSTGFVSPIVPTFNPSKQYTDWDNLIPDMKLPAGKAWISYAQKTKYSNDRAFNQGATHLSMHSLPWDTDMNEVERSRDLGRSFNGVPRTEIFMNLQPTCQGDGPNDWSTAPNGTRYNKCWWPNGPLNEQQAIEKANQADISNAMWIGETGEGNSWIASGNPMWKFFYKRLKQRYEEKFGARGIKYYIAHNYGGGFAADTALLNSSVFGIAKSKYKELLRKTKDEFPQSDFSTNGSLENTNLILGSIYLGSPDSAMDSLYSSIYSLINVKLHGLNAGIFLFGVHEWRPNNLYEYNYPEGKYFTYNKIPLDPSTHIAYGFIAQVYGTLFNEWYPGNPTGTNKLKYFNQNCGLDVGLWFPIGSTNASTQCFPLSDGTNNQHFFDYLGAPELSAFSQKLYADTFGQTNGGQMQFLKYRLDGGAWITPSTFSIDEIVDAYFEKRGFVQAQTKGNKISWFYLNAYADNKTHRIEVELPNGKILTNEVAGNGIHARVDQY